MTPMTQDEARDWERYAATASERERERQRRVAWPEYYAAQERRRRIVDAEWQD